jgi:hypothetical protein
MILFITTARLSVTLKSTLIDPLVPLRRMCSVLVFRYGRCLLISITMIQKLMYCRYEQNKQQAQKILDEVRAGGSLSCASKSANASSSPQTGATKQNSNDGKDDSVTTASSTLTKASDPTPTNTSIDPVGTESTLDSTSTIDDSTSADDNFTVNDATGSDVNSDGVVPEGKSNDFFHAQKSDFSLDDTHNTTGTTSGEGVTPDDTIQDQGALTDGVDDLLGIGKSLLVE